MQFNSFVFILMFLPITVLAYFLANKWKPVLGKLVLAVASVVFYAYSDWTLFTVLGISLVVNLAFAWALQRLRPRGCLLLIVPVLINVGLCNTATMTDLMKIKELQNPLSGLNFAGSGKPGTPLGASLLRTNAVKAGTVIGLDNRYALEQVRVGDVLVEYDKLIDRQLERAAITAISGFGKICTGASAVLKV